MGFIEENVANAVITIVLAAIFITMKFRRFFCLGPAIMQLVERKRMKVSGPIWICYQ